jgi:hypothetical protein
MKRYNNFSSLKENLNKNLRVNPIKPSVEVEIEKFINLLKLSVINDKHFTKDAK